MRCEEFFKVLGSEIGEHKIPSNERRSESLSGNTLQFFECSAIAADVDQFVLMAMIPEIIRGHPAPRASNLDIKGKGFCGH